jgi:hypothetical protein
MVRLAGEALRSVGVERPPLIQERLLYLARRSPFIGPGRSSFGPSLCPVHRGFAAVWPFALPQSYCAGVSYVEVSRPVVLMYMRNLGTYRAMTAGGPDPVGLGLCQPRMWSAGPVEMEGGTLSDWRGDVQNILHLRHCVRGCRHLVPQRTYTPLRQE